MTLAVSIDFIIWLIIAVVVMVAKGLGKLAAPSDETEEADDAPVRPSVPRPRPRATPPPVSRPVPRTASSPTVPVQIREMMERLAQPKRPAAPPPEPPPAPRPAERAPVRAAPAQAESRPDRKAQWAAALRDQSNLRNIIIGAEIIGPPKGQ